MHIYDLGRRGFVQPRRFLQCTEAGLFISAEAGLFYRRAVSGINKKSCLLLCCYGDILFG